MVTPDVNKTAGGWEFPVSELVDMLVSVVRFHQHNAVLGRNLTSVSRSQAPLTTPMMEKTHKVKLEPFLSAKVTASAVVDGELISGGRERAALPAINRDV